MKDKLTVVTETIQSKSYKITTWITTDGEVFYSEDEAIAYQNYIDAEERLEQLPYYNHYTLLKTQSDVNDWKIVYSHLELSVENEIDPPIWIKFGSNLTTNVVNYDIIDDMFIKVFAEKVK